MFVDEDWGEYPELGQNDWERVIERVEALAPHPPAEQYMEAYALLEARASGVEA